MNDIDPVRIQNLLELQLTKAGKDFLTLTQILKLRAIPKALQMTAKTKAVDALACLEPCLGEHLRIYRSDKKIYLGRNQDDAVLILKTIYAQPEAITLKQLAQKLPLPMVTLITTVNSLLAAGQLSVQFINRPETVRLFPGVINTAPLAQEAMQAGDAQAFRVAYDQVRGGREAVRIHKLREHLGWAKPRFDRVLATLRAEYKIDLHLGDPSRFSHLEVENSYEDPHGTLYISLTWVV